MSLVRVEHLIHEFERYDEDDTVIEREKAINDLSLSIGEGSFVAILGHNGSGKSTLARHLNVLLSPTEGAVYIGEMDTRDETKTLAIRQKAGMIFQNPDNQIIGNTVEEEVAFGPENLGVPNPELAKRVEYALGRVNMVAYRYRSPHHLSGGQKQRIGIAGVLAMKPACIIMDEPTAMLDPDGRKEVIRAVKELKEEEKITIILITHYMEEAVEADQVFVMDHGQLVLSGTPREVFSQVELLRRYHLDVPQVTELAWELKQAGIPMPEGILTREAFVAAFTRLYGKRKEAQDGKTDTGM